MTLRKILNAGLAAGAIATLIPAGVLAQARSAPAEAPVAQGPPIPGVCIVSEGAIIEGSKVGQAVIARLKVLKSQVDAELKPEADAINTEEQTIEAQRATMDSATFQARQANLQLRATNYEKRADLRNREMEATQEKQFGIIGQQLEPILRSLYEQKQCSILFDRDNGSVRVANPAMDISQAAINQLDQRIQTLTFDREHLDTGAADDAAAPAS